MDKYITKKIIKYRQNGYNLEQILVAELDPDDELRPDFTRIYTELYPETTLVLGQSQIPPLRDYQITTVAKSQEEFTRGATRCFIQLPTGAGKTRVMYKLISDDYNKIHALSRIGPNGSVGLPIYIILAPRIKLSEQHCSPDNLKNLELPKGTAGPTVVIINSERKPSDISKQITDWQNTKNIGAPSQYPPPIIISGTYYSISRIHDLITKYKLGQVRYLFADEAHLISRWGHTAELDKSPHKKWVMDMPPDQRAAQGLVFMTATPTKNQIANHQGLWGQLINPVSIKQLIQDKILCPIETIIPNIRIDETDDARMDNRNLCDILFKTLVKTQSHKAVIFCNTQAKCLELFKIFRQSKIYKTGPAVEYQIEPFIYVGDGYEPSTLDTSENTILENDTPDENRDASTTEDDNRPSEIDKFQDFPGPAVVFVCKKISMGYDFPPIDFIGFADPKCSRSELAQCIGRGLRTYTDKKTGYVKKCCRVFIPITPIDYSLDTLAKIKHGTLFQYLQYIKEDAGFQFDIDDREDVKKAKTDGSGFIKWSDKSELDILDVEFLDQQQIYLILSSESVLGRRTDDMNWDTYWRRKYIYYRQRNQEYGFRTIREYRDFDKNTSKPEFKDWLDPVYAPTQFGKHWLGWYDFLGIDISKFPPCINTWTAKCRELGIRNQTEYFACLVDNPTLPDEPESLYKGFTNINLLLGVCGRRR